MGTAVAEEDEQKKKNASSNIAARKEQEEAQRQLEQMLSKSRPKNLSQGIGRGVNNIVGGAVGGAGIVVLAPTIGLAAGAQQGGILGAALGVSGGAVVGVLGGAAVAVAGVVGGVTQMVRGVMAVPNAVIQPRKGKWWDETEGKWVFTNLEKEKEELTKVPDDDNDLLGAARAEAESETAGSSSGGGGGSGESNAATVKDTKYYDALEVDPKADANIIKKQYYKLARMYHPDKVGTDDKEAAEKFKTVAEAYQVLSDVKLRSKYDREGLEGLSADRTSIAKANVDPSLLFAFLFGSDKFKHYVGTLGMATAASIGDSPKVNVQDGRMIQKRRCGRLALLLADRLDMHVKGNVDEAKDIWKMEGEELVCCSYGYELLQIIGQAYTLSALQFLGSMDSGIGMPSISNWAKSKKAKLKQSSEDSKAQRDTMFAGMSAMQMQMKLQQELAKAKTDEEKHDIENAFQREMTTTMLKVMWTTTVVDITNTLHTTCQMVLFDTNVDKESRKKRGVALQVLGETLVAVPKPHKKEGGGDGDDDDDDDDDPMHIYEAAAMAAMLETVKRKEEASFARH